MAHLLSAFVALSFSASMHRSRPTALMAINYSCRRTQRNSLLANRCRTVVHHFAGAVVIWDKYGDQIRPTDQPVHRPQISLL